LNETDFTNDADPTTTLPVRAMSEFSVPDYRHMARALQLARNGLTTAHPNPRVGCVLVRDGTVVGEGWHRKTGEAHAEVNAIAAAGHSAAGATAYVTLEPCGHTGKTGPCTEALIRARVAKVVFALEDPSPHANGRSRATLENAGIEVRSGLMQTEAHKLNEGFLMRMSHHRPFVRLKVAASLDGGTAMRSGQSQWITGDAARRDVQKFRAMSGAILTGVGTVLADDPLLTVRGQSLALCPPLRVVVDSRLRTPPAAKLLREAGETLVFCVDDGNRGALEKAGAAVHRVAQDRGRVDLSEVLRALADREVNDVLVEAGPVLSGSLLAEGYVDELVIYQAPHMMGSETSRMFATPEWTQLERRRQLHIVDMRRVGQDLRIVARPVSL
jgi:diaminohydroxyphosphoribosylaminopyrimidine deaminase/5-amino-6-(5-phosphoribosylamino)uracil reductase